MYGKLPTRLRTRKITASDERRCRLQHVQCNRSSPTTFRRDRLRHGSCNRDSPTIERRDRCQNGACKIDSSPDVRPDRFKHGACKRNSPPTEDETDSITGRVKEALLPTAASVLHEGMRVPMSSQSTQSKYLCNLMENMYTKVNDVCVCEYVCTY